MGCMRFPQAPIAALRTIRRSRLICRSSFADRDGEGLEVAFEATVSYYNGTDLDLFVQDGSEAIYVVGQPNQDLAPGDRVLVRGKTQGSFQVPFAIEGIILHGSASMGIAMYPEDGVTSDSLLSVADAAMYRAKQGQLQLMERAPSENGPSLAGMTIKN